jgi:hypothetical protein
MNRQRAGTGLWDGGFGAVELRRVQPYEATKAYVCPGCHHRIAEGTGHYVAVPTDAPPALAQGLLGPPLGRLASEVPTART